MSSSHDTPGIGFHPPLLHAAAFAAGWGLERLVARLPPSGTVPRGAALAAGIALAAIAIAIACWAAWTMHRARTGIPVHHPVNALVTHGPFAWSRNPIYLALNMLYVGAALVLEMGWPLLLLPVLLIALRILVIEREERFLERRFPDSYAVYRAKVRRWL
jgi:protein-S-isoprenylcysteine O-methyltransferase Ste14